MVKLSCLALSVIQTAFAAKPDALNPQIYPEAAGTSDWGKYATVCASGSMQSPITLPKCDKMIERTPLEITWADQEVEILHTGQTVKIIAKGAEPGKMIFKESGITKEYTLKECQIRYGLEHRIEVEGAMSNPDPDDEKVEVQCVHDLVGSDTNQRTGIVSIFFEETAVARDHPFWSQFDESNWYYPEAHLVHDPSRRLASSYTPQSKNKTTWNGPIDFKLLTETSSQNSLKLYNFYSYSGSFTMPPCTESVDWYIIREVAKISTAQMDKIKMALTLDTETGTTQNFRRVHKLYTRTVYGCTVLTPPVTNENWYPYEGTKWATAVGINSNNVCASGHKQSPIDFAACAVPADRSPIVPSWPSQTVKIFNNGHTVQVNPLGSTGGKGSMVADGSDYNLLQCHFHWASEHRVGGRQYPLEVHCVHQAAGSQDGGKTFGVFGLFFMLGEDKHPFLAEIEDHLVGNPLTQRRLKSSEVVGFDIMGNPLGGRQLADVPYPASDWDGPVDFSKLHSGLDLSDYWSYAGSLTSPPCTEAVNWYVVMDVATMQQTQMDKFRTSMGWIAQGGNFRPPQAVGSRVVQGCQTLSDDAYNVAEAVSQTMTDRIKAVVSATVEKELKTVLEDGQSAQDDLLVVIMTIVCAVFVLMIVVLVAIFMVMQTMSRGKAAPSGDSAVIGNSAEGAGTEESL